MFWWHTNTCTHIHKWIVHSRTACQAAVSLQERCGTWVSFSVCASIYTVYIMHTHMHTKVLVLHLCVIFRGSCCLERWTVTSCKRFIVEMKSCPSAGLVYQLPSHTHTSLKSFVRHKTLIHSINEREVSFGHPVRECVRVPVSEYAAARSNERPLITGSIKRGFDNAWTWFGLEWVLWAWPRCKTCSSFSGLLKSSLIGFH